jgi:hypothetical protein
MSRKMNFISWAVFQTDFKINETIATGAKKVKKIKKLGKKKKIINSPEEHKSEQKLLSDGVDWDKLNQE